jgi:hypothetical protein
MKLSAKERYIARGFMIARDGVLIYWSKDLALYIVSVLYANLDQQAHVSKRLRS